MSGVSTSHNVRPFRPTHAMLDAGRSRVAKQLCLQILVGKQFTLPKIRSEVEGIPSDSS